MFLLNGNPLPLDTPFTTPDGTQYPADWLRLATPEERAAIGITEEPDPIPYDQRFFWGYDQDGNLIPKDHSELIEYWISQTKQTAGTLLSPTDWMIVRQTETGAETPAEVLLHRFQIRELSNGKELQIRATTTTEELAAYITGPDYPVWSNHS